MLGMFWQCKELTTIYVSNDFVTDQFVQGSYVDQNVDTISSTSMFTDCINLKGNEGTKYKYPNIDKTYAHIDGGESNPGYFSPKN